MLFWKRERERKIGREVGGRDMKNWMVLSSQGAWELWTKLGSAGTFCPTSASPGSREEALQLPASEGKRHPSAQPGTERFWHCPLWPPDKNVRSQILSYPKSIWRVLRIKNKCGRLPSTCAHSLSQALTCFHGHSGWSPDLSQRGRHQAQRRESGTSAPHPAGEAEWISPAVADKQGWNTAGPHRSRSLANSRSLFGCFLVDTEL